MSSRHVQWTRLLLGLATAGGVAATSSRAHAESPREPGTRPTAGWLALQTIPSPSVATGAGGARFGLLWQVTPISYVHCIHRGLTPWRFFVVEPNLRQGGSVELFFTPGVYFGSTDVGLLEPGVRSYFPIVERGEWLSASVATSLRSAGGEPSAAFEAGAYVLFGIVGAQVSVAPGPRQPLASTLTLRLRYF